jgi:hypothetical protein
MRACTLPTLRGAISSLKVSWQKNSTVLIFSFSDAFSGISEISCVFLWVLKGATEMQHRHSSEENDEAVSLAGVSASSSARRSGQTAVLVFSQRPAAAQRAAEEAISPDWEVPPTIGEMAVRLIAEWSLPRMRLLGSSGRDDDPSAR